MILDGLDNPLSWKNEGSYKLRDKTQYSNKQASISFLVNHGPQILATSILMTLLDCLGHVCELRYLKPTIFAFFGSLKLA